MEFPKKFFLFSLLITLLISISGCRDASSLSPDRVSMILSQKGYTIKRFSLSIRHPYSERPYICLTQNQSGEEWLIAVYPSGKMDETELGVDGRLTWDQMVNSLRQQGLQDDSKLFFGLSPKGILYWQYIIENKENTSIYFKPELFIVP